MLSPLLRLAQDRLCQAQGRFSGDAGMTWVRRARDKGRIRAMVGLGRWGDRGVVRQANQERWVCWDGSGRWVPRSATSGQALWHVQDRLFGGGSQAARSLGR